MGSNNKIIVKYTTLRQKDKLFFDFLAKKSIKN